MVSGLGCMFTVRWWGNLMLRKDVQLDFTTAQTCAFTFFFSAINCVLSCFLNFENPFLIYFMNISFICNFSTSYYL